MCCPNHCHHHLLLRERKINFKLRGTEQVIVRKQVSLKIDLTSFGVTRILSMIIKQKFTEPEIEVKWYCDSIEEIVIVYVRI